MARYGVRDKMKPFSSLLLFSQPRASDQIPLIEDPVGSFVDVEQLSLLRLAERREERRPTGSARCTCSWPKGIDEMLAIRSGAPAAAGPAAGRTLAAASLADVCATMAQWLGLPSPQPGGQPIAALLG